MKHLIVLLIAGLTFSCNQQADPLTDNEIEEIKKEIIERSEKHANDLENLDFESVMTFYAKDLIVFGDGYYWGDYLTMDGIWKDILGEGGWKKMLKFDFS